MNDQQRENDHRCFGYEPCARDLLYRHLDRIGAREATLTDHYASHEVAMLSNLLDITEAALSDEGVDPSVARKVIEKIIYGGAPSSAAAEQRSRLQTEMAKMIRNQPVRVVWVPK